MRSIIGHPDACSDHSQLATVGRLPDQLADQTTQDAERWRSGPTVRLLLESPAAERPPRSCGDDTPRVARVCDSEEDRNFAERDSQRDCRRDTQRVTVSTPRRRMPLPEI